MFHHAALRAEEDARDGVHSPHELGSSVKAELVRFGIAIDAPLLEQLDALVGARGVTRSEVIRDLVRAEIMRTQTGVGVPAVAALTLVYNHHVRALTEKLTEIQHGLGDQVRSTMHVHLDAERCLEVVILQGRSDVLQKLAETLLATRGVTHGGIQIVPDSAGGEHRHPHAHAHGAAPHVHPPPRRPRARAAKRA